MQTEQEEGEKPKRDKLDTSKQAVSAPQTFLAPQGKPFLAPQGILDLGADKKPRGQAYVLPSMIIFGILYAAVVALISSYGREYVFVFVVVFSTLSAIAENRDNKRAAKWKKGIQKTMDGILSGLAEVNGELRVANQNFESPVAHAENSHTANSQPNNDLQELIEMLHVTNVALQAQLELKLSEAQELLLKADTRFLLAELRKANEDLNRVLDKVLFGLLLDEGLSSGESNFWEATEDSEAECKNCRKGGAFSGGCCSCAQGQALRERLSIPVTPEERVEASRLLAEGYRQISRKYNLIQAPNNGIELEVTPGTLDALRQLKAEQQEASHAVKSEEGRKLFQLAKDTFNIGDSITYTWSNRTHVGRFGGFREPWAGKDYSERCIDTGEPKRQVHLAKISHCQGKEFPGENSK